MANLNLTDIQNYVENNELDDQTKSSGGGGGFERTLLPAKYHPIRLVGYTELGIQTKQKYQSEETEEVDLVRLTIEVLSKDGMRTDESGKVVGARRLYIECKKSTHEKSTLRKLFELMREGDSTITHFAQMIGTKAWKLKVQWEQNRTILQSAKARKEALEASKADPNNKDLRIWEVWKSEGVPMISPAVNPILDDEGEDTGEVAPIKVHDVVGKLEFFLWDTPELEHWESLYVDGTWDRKDADGKETKVSKNIVQERIKEAVNYAGSPLEALLEGKELPVEDVLETVDDVVDEPVEGEVSPDQVDEVDESDNELDELGL